PRGAPGAEPEIPDLFLRTDAVKHPRHPPVEGIRHAFERLAFVHTFRRKANPDDLLWCGTARAPQAGFLASGSQIPLARIGLPGPRTGIELADLHAMRLALAQARHPIIAVAAGIDQPSAPAQIVLGRIQ